MALVPQFLRLIIVINSGIRLVTSKREINIIGFFPTSEGNVGRGVIPAVDLALEMVNRNSTLLMDYELKMYFNDSKCDMAVATKLLFDTLNDRRDNAMLFGDTCFEVTGPMAQISKWWNMSQLSYGDTNPVLSDRASYPKLFRVVPSDSDFNPARLALLRHFMWRRVGTIFQDASRDSPRYGYAHNRLVSLLENSTIQIHNPERLSADKASEVKQPQAHNRIVNRVENSTFQVASTESFADDPASAVRNLRDRDVRIILGNFAPNMARRVFCEAYQNKMYGEKYQWIILGGSYHDGLRKTADKSIKCTEHQVKIAMHGYIATDILPLSSGTEQTESELSPQEYLALYNERREKATSKFHGYAFDGIWVIAKALDKLLKNPPEPATKDEEWEMVFRSPELVEALDETNFQGVTGTVKFQNGDRIGGIEIQQYQDGNLVKVGEFIKDGDRLSLEGYQPLIWTGSGPPRDGYLRKSEMQRVNTPIYAALCVLSGLGILMALVFLSTNIYFRKHRYIKMSSPNMNNIIIVGCIMNYVSVFLLGTDGGLLPSNRFPLMCSARAWVLAVGFTLAFGAMFSKTWRVHAIFTNIKLNKKVIKDYKLFFIVCVLLLLDAVILALWQGIDPLQRSVKSLASEIVGDVEIIPLIEYCHSKHMTAWMATLYVYKGLLLVFGCFLAWETRQVSIPALNDSKYIGMSVYNVVIMCVCGAAVSFVIKDQPNAAFIIIGLFIIFCTTITLCLVFVPKVVELQRDPEGEDKRVRATLKKPSKRDKANASDLHDKVKLLSDENIRYKDILEEKNKEIRELLRLLGEDVNSFDYTIKSPMHKSVLTLRQKGNPEMSPSKVSRSSVGTEDDNASCYSDSSLTQLYIDSPEHHRHSSYLHSRNSNSVTESIELTDIGRKSTTGKLSPIRDSREYMEVDSYDPYSGVYLGPSEPEVTVVENINYRPPATEEHPIIQRYSGVSFLDECHTGHPDHLSEDSDQDESDPDISNNISVHSAGSLPGASPEEEGLLGVLYDESQPFKNIQGESENEENEIDMEADDLEELECEVLEENDSEEETDSDEGDTEREARTVSFASPDISSVENNSSMKENNSNIGTSNKVNNNTNIPDDNSADNQPTANNAQLTENRSGIMQDDIILVDITPEGTTVTADDEKLIDDGCAVTDDDSIKFIDNDGVLINLMERDGNSNDDWAGMKDTVDDISDPPIGCGVEQRVVVVDTCRDNVASNRDTSGDGSDVITGIRYIFTSDSDSDSITDTAHVNTDVDGASADTTDHNNTIDTTIKLSPQNTGSTSTGVQKQVTDMEDNANETDVHPLAECKSHAMSDAAIDKNTQDDKLEGAHALYEEAKEIFITDSLASQLEGKAEKHSRVTGDNPLLRPLLSGIKHRKVAPKSKEHKVELEKGSRTFMCDVVEYI